MFVSLHEKIIYVLHLYTCSPQPPIQLKKIRIFIFRFGFAVIRGVTLLLPFSGCHSHKVNEINKHYEIKHYLYNHMHKMYTFCKIESPSYRAIQNNHFC